MSTVLRTSIAAATEPDKGSDSKGSDGPVSGEAPSVIVAADPKK